MSEYYIPKRSKNLYEPGSKLPFKLSRSKLEMFLNCPRCFYMDRRLGVGQPPGYPFNLNSAVDHLLKKEFDVHRAKKTKHPLMEHYGVDAVPFPHALLDVWRENFKGITYHHEPTNLIISGAVDDIWVNPKGELIIVDYKATSKDSEVTLDAPWQDGYKHQMEIYQWLFRQNGYKVSPTGFFVYCNGKRDRAAFDSKLEFDIKLLPYTGNDNWIEGVITKASACLNGSLPPMSQSCDFCLYRQSASSVETQGLGKVSEKTAYTKTVVKRKVIKKPAAKQSAALF
jgi:hypothetical protein